VTRRGQLPASFTMVPGTRKIMISSTSTEFEEIKELVAELDVEEAATGRDTRVIAVRNITPAEMTTILTEFMRRPGATQRYNPRLLGDVKIMASSSASAVIISGPPDRLDELVQLAEKVDNAKPEGEDKIRQIRVFALKVADPNTVAGVI